MTRSRCRRAPRPTLAARRSRSLAPTPPGPCRRGDRSVEKIGWPDDLHYAIYWSGVAADTRDKIERYANAPGKESRAELAASANECTTAFESGKSAGILDALRDYCAVLRHFDKDHELGIYGAGHAVMAEAAAGSDAVYKPCGAGGGDRGDEAGRELVGAGAQRLDGQDQVVVDQLRLGDGLAVDLQVSESLPAEVDDQRFAGFSPPASSSRYISANLSDFGAGTMKEVSVILSGPKTCSASS